MKHLYNQLFVCLLMLMVLSSQGQTFQQANQIGGVGYNKIQDVTTDASDNFYAIGTFNNQITVPQTMGGVSTVDKTFLYKYDAVGSVTWSKYMYTTGSGSMKASKIAVDGAGNIFVAGSLYGSTVYFNGFVSGNPATLNGPSFLVPDGFVAKYASDGSFLWVRAIGSASNNDEVFDLAIDKDGDVYVVGYIAADATVYGRDNASPQGTYPSTATGLSTITGQGGTAGLLDVVVAKFSNSGTFEWGMSLGSVNGAERGTAITTDINKNVYVAGQLFKSFDLDPGAGVTTLTESTPQGSGDVFIAEYSTAGAFIKAGQISGGGVENINKMHIGSSGVLNVAGSFTGFIDADITSGVQNLTAAGSGLDILLGAYDLATFSPVFIQKIGTANADDEALGIKTNASGNIYVTGYFSGTAVNFNPAGTALNLSSVGGKDAFIAKYNASGINQWGFGVGSTSDDRGSAMDFNTSYIYAGGYYTGTIGDFNPGAGTSSLTNLGLEDAYWSKYQECSSLPVISTQPTGKTVCAGAAINLTIGVAGSFSYQWKKDGVNITDGGNISGATTTTLNISPSVATDAGSYTCVVTSCGTSVTSNAAAVVVNTPPLISVHPVSKSICSGANTSFSVTASGTSLTYQWKLNNVALSNNAVYAGTQAAILNLVNPAAAQAGDYTVVITGSCTPALTSDVAKLTVGAGIAITSQPTATAACLGGNATFSTTATGTALTYQWQKNGVNLTDGGAISGALTDKLNITGVVAGDATSYKAVITGSCGSITTSAVNLTITSAPVISTQPAASQSICAGQSTTFSVTAVGATSYQWKKNGTDLTDGGNISGAITSSLLITGTTATDAATYTVLVTGACAPTKLSADAALTVNALAVISTQPVAQTVCSGATVTFSVVATGADITYQWQRNNVNVVNGGSISGATTDHLTITGVAVADAGNYKCIVTGTCSTVTSNLAALTVNSTATIAANPVSTTICEGQTHTFTLGTTGSNITWQWKKDGVNLTDGGTISGALTASLKITGVVATDAGDYSVTINNSCSGTLNSTAATLTVNKLPVIITNPKDSTICGSAPVSFSVVATGTGLTYQWKKGTVSLTDGGTISGSTSAILKITPAVAADAGSYTCVVSGTCAPGATSLPAALAVGTIAAITAQPTDKIVCEGSSASLSAGVSGIGNSYQWKKNGVNLINGPKVSGATSMTLTINTIDVSFQDSYTLVTGNVCSGFITSNPATITVNTLPNISTNPTSKSICTGTPTSFSVAATGTTLTYQWKKDGVVLTDGGNISGAQTPMLSLAASSGTDAGTYSVMVSGSCTPSVPSANATLTITSGSTIISQPTSKSVCTGNSAVFVCDATGGSLTHQWKKDGVALTDGGNISGSNTFQLKVSAVTSADVGSYVCEISSACSPLLISDPASLTVNASTNITAQPANATVCEGSPASFTISATGTGLTYQWKKGASAISGATNATYGIAASSAATDAGSYVVDITSACGVLSGNTVTLTVNKPISISAQPASTSACPGENVTFTIAATGSVSTYKWKKNGVDLVDGGTIAGSSTPTLSISSIGVTDEANYSVLLTAACGSDVPSVSAALSLATAPVISTQPPASKLICAGQTLNLTIGVTGSSTIIYQWQKDGVNLVDGGSVSGAKTPSLSITNVSVSDEGNYVCIVSTSCSTPTSSNTTVVTTTFSSSITLQPITATVCPNQTVLFKITMPGAGVVYQWQYKSNTGTTYSDVINGGKYSGAHTANLVILNADLAEVGSYRCMVTENCGAVQYSAPAGLIIDSPTIIQHPYPQSISAGQLAKFTVGATGSNLTYQWYKDGVALTNGGKISGAKLSTLMITSTAPSDNGDYTCQVKGICMPPATSLAGVLTVSITTSITGSELNDTNVRIYPKPADVQTTIEITDREGADISIALFDAQGTVIKIITQELETAHSEINLNTTELPQGMYFVQIQLGNEFYTDKVEVIH